MELSPSNTGEYFKADAVRVLLAAAPAPVTPAASVDTLPTFDWGRDGMVPTDDPSRAYCYTRDALAHTTLAVADGVIRGWNDAWGVAQKEIDAKQAEIASLTATQQHAQAALSDEQIINVFKASGVNWWPNDSDILNFARAILAASHQPAAAPAAAIAPEGWKLVPIKLTGVQHAAARSAVGFTAMYAAALEAAPTPSPAHPAAQQGGELPQDERAAFEAWHITEYGYSDDNRFSKDRWNVWQAALAQRAASVPAFVPAGYANETEFLRQQLTDARRTIKAHETVLAEVKAASVPAQAVQPVEPIYQVSMAGDTWMDIDKERYTKYSDVWRRIVYAAPVPAASVSDVGREAAQAAQDARVVIANLNKSVVDFLQQYDQGNAPGSEQEAELRAHQDAAMDWLMLDLGRMPARAKLLKGGA